VWAELGDSLQWIGASLRGSRCQHQKGNSSICFEQEYPG